MKRGWAPPAGMALVFLAGAFLGGLGCGPRNQGEDKAPAAAADGGAKADAKAAREKKIEAARAKLSAEDRALVDAQDYCPIMPKQKLGSMGVPFKLTVKGQPVFVCCKGCKGTAEDDPDATLQAVEELKAKNKK
jgi:hypothetical protein